MWLGIRVAAGLDRGATVRVYKEIGVGPRVGVCACSVCLVVVVQQWKVYARAAAVRAALNMILLL